MMKRVCVVIPAFNESESLPETHRRLIAVFAAENSYSFSILFVDDGSTDTTPAILNSMALRDSRVNYLSLSRNFGHQAALSAGLDHAEGDVVICMDADLQHPPEVIPALL